MQTSFDDIPQIHHPATSAPQRTYYETPFESCIYCGQSGNMNESAKCKCTVHHFWNEGECCCCKKLAGQMGTYFPYLSIANIVRSVWTCLLKSNFAIFTTVPCLQFRREFSRFIRRGITIVPHAEKTRGLGDDVCLLVYSILCCLFGWAGYGDFVYSLLFSWVSPYELWYLMFLVFNCLIIWLYCIYCASC